MTPDFRILANANDITSTLRDRLISLSVSDSSGIKSDSVEITLDDRGGKIEIPKKGAELEVSLGYKEVGLIRMGLFTVDEVELSGSPDTMTIRAKAADMRGSLKEQKSRSWDDVTVGSIVEKIASEHELTPKIGVFLADIDVPHLDQSDESDLNFLARLARQYDVVAKPAAGFLLFVGRGEAKSAAGRSLAPVTVRRIDVSRFRITMSDRGRYQSAIAHYHDTAKAKRIPVKVGDGAPASTVRGNFSSKAIATAAATSRLEGLRRGEQSLSFSMIGNPELTAECPITLSGFRTGASIDWVCVSATHSFSSTGFTTSIDAKTPKP